MKKRQKRSKRSYKRRKSKKAGSNNFWVFLSVLLLFAAGLAIGYLVGVKGRKGSLEVTSVEVASPVRKTPAEKRAAVERGVLSSSERKEVPAERREGERVVREKEGSEAEKPQKPKEPPFKAVIAIVIDDFGYRKSDVDRFKRLPYPIAFSVIPFTPYERYSADEAVKHGKSVMLHIPMEPNSSAEKIEKLEKKTKGMLRIRMSDSEIRLLLKKEMERVPYAVGANNHMGSKFTRYRRGMKVVLDELNKAGLFFLDSRTVSNSVGVSVGKEMGVVVLRRDIFLDNSRDVEYIKHQLDELAKIALKKGYAIAIGHPHISTYLALKEKLPQLEKKGIKVVPIEEIYSYLGGKDAGSFQKTGVSKRREVSLLSGMPSRNSP